VRRAKPAILLAGGADRLAPWPFAVYRGTALVEWRRLARDRADLPPAQPRTEPSVEVLDVGETRDVEFNPARGEYRLVVGDPKQPAWVQVLLAR